MIAKLPYYFHFQLCKYGNYLVVKMKCGDTSGEIIAYTYLNSLLFVLVNSVSCIRSLRSYFDLQISSSVVSIYMQMAHGLATSLCNPGPFELCCCSCVRV